MKHYWELFRWWSGRLGRAVQTAVVTVLLVFVYLFGFGATRLAAMLFFRRYLKLYTTDRAKRSLWIDAEGYDSDRLHRQF